MTTAVCFGGQVDPVENESESEECPICGGSGVIFTPAHERAGIIIEDREYKCSCRKAPDNEERDEDY